MYVSSLLHSFECHLVGNLFAGVDGGKLTAVPVCSPKRQDAELEPTNVEYMTRFAGFLTVEMLTVCL